jgi:hypothetical protein
LPDFTPLIADCTAACIRFKTVAIANGTGNVTLGGTLHPYFPFIQFPPKFRTPPLSGYFLHNSHQTAGGRRGFYIRQREAICVRIRPHLIPSMKSPSSLAAAALVGCFIHVLEGMTARVLTTSHRSAGCNGPSPSDGGGCSSTPTITLIQAI